MDGITGLAQPAGSTLTNVYFYNNMFGPGWGGSYETGGIWMSDYNGGMTGQTIFNNIFVGDSADAADGFIAILATKGTWQIYNNTFIGGTTGKNAIGLGQVGHTILL